MKTISIKEVMGLDGKGAQTSSIVIEPAENGVIVRVNTRAGGPARVFTGSPEAIATKILDEIKPLITE